MKRQFAKPLLSFTLVLSACTSVNLVTPESSEPAPFVETPPTTEIAPTYENCGFIWASQELPDLSKKVNDILQTVDKNITGNAYAFGENCVYADGHSTFGAMETDFRVKVNVPDLKDEKALGDWIGRVMEVIIKLAADDIPGPQPGRVEFNFIKNETENKFLYVSIAKYQKQSAGISGIELYRLFNNNP